VAPLLELTIPRQSRGVSIPARTVAALAATASDVALWIRIDVRTHGTICLDIQVH
jgi:hypothetical protein